MGDYINRTPSGPLGYRKAQAILNDCDAIRIARPSSFADVPDGYALICVVDNGPFEAAVLIKDEREFSEFTRGDDGRPKVWIVMDKALAIELADNRTRSTTASS